MNSKHVPVIFLQALLANQRIKIGKFYYYLGGDLLDLCVSHDKDSVQGVFVSPNLRQFINLARTMTSEEVTEMVENLRKSGVS